MRPHTGASQKTFTAYFRRRYVILPSACVNMREGLQVPRHKDNKQERFFDPNVLHRAVSVFFGGKIIRYAGGGAGGRIRPREVATWERGWTQQEKMAVTCRLVNCKPRLSVQE